MLVMVKNPRQKPARTINLSSGEALRILASLIAQFHIKQLNHDKKPNQSIADNEEINNDQSLS